MDLDHPDLAALEEKLYSSFHHSFNATTNNDAALQSHASATSTPLRIVTKTSVVNNCTPNTGSRTMRYWASSSGGELITLKKPFLGERKSGGNPKQKPPEGHTQASPTSTGVERGEPRKAFFTPYQSLLNSSSLNSDTPLSTANGTIVFDKVQEVQITSDPPLKEKKLKKKQRQPLNPVEKRLAGLVKVIEGSTRAETVKKCVQAKKAKATVVRQNLASKSGSSKSQVSVVAEITLDSSDDETKLPLQRGKPQPRTLEPSDDETNDVVLVPGPEVPQICIDCSDDEVAQDSFVLPMLKRQKKKVSPSANSPRCQSPSNSSIMSDDFIGHLDRSRMNDSLGDSIPNDEELDCTLNESTARPGKKKTTASNAPKRLRVPSISSDCTIASNSDTTDPDRRHPPVPKAKKANQKSVSPSRSSPPCQSEKVLEGTPKPSGSLLPQFGECIPLNAKGGMKTKGKSKNVDSAVLSNCSKPASSVTAELTVKKQAVNNGVLKTNSITEKDALSGRMVKSKNKSKNASHLADSTNAERGGENVTQNISPDEDSMYKQITRKLKDGEACFDESSVSSESDYDLSTVLDKSTVSRKTTIGSASETTSHALETISSESDCEDLVIITSAKRASATESNADGTTQGPKKKSLGPKRKKFHSENLSDEDFACVLTDIVQAISDGDDDDDDDDDGSGGGGGVIINDLEKDVPVDYWLDTEVNPSHPYPSQSIPSVNESSLNINEESEAQGPLLASDVAPAPVLTINDSDDDVVQVEGTRFFGIDDSSPGVMGDAGCVWNKEMTLFYNGTATEDNFSMAAAIRKMPRDAKHWKIVDQDRFPDPPKKDMLCNNCGERGHMRFKCRNAPKLRICHMCGQQGHQEPRCPKTMCLNCGSRTETFVYECATCRNDFRRFCYICGVRGHTTVRCPDHWRRYHSTTEDNVQLVANYQRNRDTKQCSICGKFGHYAHSCRTAHRIFVHPIPTTEIKSYHPAYHRMPMSKRGPAPYAGQDECSRYNLFDGDASKCELNLETLSMNSNGFYYRFAQSAGLLSEPSIGGVLPDAATDRATKTHRTRKSYQNHKRPSQDDGQQTEYVPIPQQQSPIVLEEQQLKRTELPNGNDTMACSVALIEEDSNYSFSELLPNGEESKLSCDVTVVGKSDSVETSEPFHNADFISLTTQPEDEAMLLVSDLKADVEKQHASGTEVTDAKICLMKSHTQLLISTRGRKFLKDASSRHMLKWSITFESIGNVLLVSGQAANQDAFHRELVGFLQQTEGVWLGAKVPGERRSAVRFIRKHLDLLTKSYENIETIFARYQQLQGKMKWKKSERDRRLLNVVLFGQWGMREGRTHVQRLLTSIDSLKRSEEPEIDPNARDVIDVDIRYIFSSYDHGDYKQIIAEFEELRKNQQLTKISCQELGMSKAEAKTIVTKADEYAFEQSPARDVNHSTETLAAQGAQHFEDGSSTDIILNTADGRIHSPEYSADWQEAKMIETGLLAQPHPTLPQPTIEDSFATTNNAGGNMSIQVTQSSLQTLVRSRERSTFHCRDPQQQKVLEHLKEITEMNYRRLLKKKPSMKLSRLISEILEEEQTKQKTLKRRNERSHPNFRWQLLRDLTDLSKIAKQRKLSPVSQWRLCDAISKTIQRTQKRIEKRTIRREKKKEKKAEERKLGTKGSRVIKQRTAQKNPNR
ncbi:uncharacterized protein LOC128268456 isoform X1 [Anopheles cruzii]|uniref:uncharacterized protein LOC128268456 isoform X1 n=1 Tax=Anopheles cruzii TaxID=68878 RepID=UPI0022EC3211|nr:uncharacterized protein LOC128268456 isoform X1 [Anopheles cruzii]